MLKTQKEMNRKSQDVSPTKVKQIVGIGKLNKIAKIEILDADMAEKISGGRIGFCGDESND